MGDAGDFRELFFRIERAVFRGIGNVHQTGEDHVLMVAVGVVGRQIGFQLGRDHLARMAGDGEHLVAAVLDGARFVAGDVAGAARHGALVGTEVRGDDRFIGLGAAGDEEYIAAGASRRGKDLSFARAV